MRPLTPARDIVLLLARILLGVVIAAHGYQKLVLNGMDATTAGFEKMGVPMAGVSAWIAMIVELGGGILLVLGALTPLAGLAIAAVMAGAFFFAHMGSGVFVADGGWELVAVIGLAAAVFAAVGPGRFSVDHALTERRHQGDAPAAATGATAARDSVGSNA